MASDDDIRRKFSVVEGGGDPPPDVPHRMASEPPKAQVLAYPGITSLNMPAEQMLDLAKNANLDQIVIMGYAKDGEFYFASSIADGGAILWLMETAKLEMFNVSCVHNHEPDE